MCQPLASLVHATPPGPPGVRDTGCSALASQPATSQPGLSQRSTGASDVRPNLPPTSHHENREEVRPSLPDEQHGRGQGGQELAEALYDYHASASDELSFQKGDTLVVVERITSDWLSGHRLGSSPGRPPRLFPANYVRSTPTAATSVSRNRGNEMHQQYTPPGAAGYPPPATVFPAPGVVFPGIRR